MTMRRTTSALMAAALGLSAVAAWAEQPSQVDMQKQIEGLQAQIQQLQSQQAKPAFTAKDVDVTVDSIMRDADRRSQLMAESGGFLGGWMDDKFVIRSADGNYSMSPGIQFQFRSVSVCNDRSDAEGGHNYDNGFEVRRLKFSLDGTAITKNLYYNFVWATDRHTGDLINEEAYVKYRFADNWSVKLGQYKELIYQETQTTSRRVLLVDRSIVSEALFGGDAYSQGIELIYDSDTIQGSIGFTDGYNSRNTNFQDPPANSYDFGMHARVQYKVFGDWKSYTDQTAMGNKKDLLVIGAGADWSQNGDIDVLRHAVDAQWESGPLGVFAAYTGQYVRFGGGDDVYNWGIVLQAGYMLNSQWEVFGRWAYLKFDDATVSAGNENGFCELTAGFNYYLKGHSAKFTVDVGFLPSGAPADFDSIGVLSNNGNSEWYLRAQFQLLL